MERNRMRKEYHDKDENFAHKTQAKRPNKVFNDHLLSDDYQYVIVNGALWSDEAHWPTCKS
eukprot:scaffold3048_cov192-Amphora_coffeaeformis.AAC.9